MNQSALYLLMSAVLAREVDQRGVFQNLTKLVQFEPIIGQQADLRAILIGVGRHQ